MSSSAINLKGAIGKDALRNLIANPAFDEWSRGISFDITAAENTINLTNGPDNWFLRYFPDDGTTSDTLILEKKKHTIGQTQVEGNPIYYTRIRNGEIAAGSDGNEQITLSQRIPNVRLLQDETVSLSFYTRGGTSGMKLGVGFQQVFGISGGPDEFADEGTASDPVTVQGQQVSLETEWARHKLRFNIPSITGKSIGTSGSNYTELNFFVQAGETAAKTAFRNLPAAVDYAGDTLDIANVQLERGVDTSTFENIQYSNTFAEMIGAQVTAIAAGQVTKAAATVSDALNLTSYQGLTALTAGDSFYITLNDANSSDGNNILKFGQFFNTNIVTDPIYIVSPSLAGHRVGSPANAIESLDVFATVVDGDKRVLEITSFNELETSDDNNIVLNIFAIQLGVPSGLYASDPEAAGSGSSDSTGGEDSTPGDNTIITEFEDGTGCIDCDVDGNVLDIP